MPAGNLKWSAAGLTLPDPGNAACESDRTAANASGRRVDRSYDARNRLIALGFPDGNGSQSRHYTADGLPSSVVTANDAGASSVTNSYLYNKRRLLVGETQAQTGGTAWSTGYGYSGNGHLASLSYPAGLSIAYAPNGLGQATQAGPYASGVRYHPNGAIAQFTYGNGLVHTLTQNTRQLPERSRDASAATLALDDHYDFDANANVAAISDGLAGQRGNRTLGYDGLDRLTSAVSPMYGTASYGYDVLDNLTRVVAPGRNHQYLYDARQRLTNVTSGGASVIGLGYDVQGNLQNKNGQAYSFDTGNRLRGASGLESYRYDGEGRRIQTTSAANVPIYWVYGQNGQLLYERDERTGRRLQYVYLGGSLVAQHSRPIGTDTLTMLYYHTDALGTPVALTDSTGTVQQRSEYEAYGRLLNRASNNRPGYTGHVEDAATGLTYMQQRYYDPAIGRFLSVDPVTADGNTGSNFNRYWYANNNPYIFTDPDGRESGAGYATGEYTMALPVMTSEAAGLILDFTPGISDVKGFVDAYNEPSLPNIASAVIGLAGPVGDAAGKMIKTASKVEKATKVEKIGGKFIKTTEVRPGKGPGQSRAEYVRVKNENGKTIRTHKDSYDRAGNFQGRKPLTGGPEGRPVPPPPPPPPPPKKRDYM